MKFKLISNIEERFTSVSNKEKHYYRHIISNDDGIWKMPNMSADEYEQLADALAETPASKLNDRSADVIGYITKDGRIVKHQKSTNYTVVYVIESGENLIISLYRQSLSKFYHKLNTPNIDMTFGKNI